MGVFSTLNNLTDISLEPRFGAFMGLTQEELEKNFQPFISQRARDFGLSVNELLELIKLHYDGFSFDGVTKLYNPFSTLKFFNSELNEFLHYWFESGSNTIIRKFLKNKGLTVDEFKGLAIDINFASSPGEIEETPPHGFLYQTGYLSLFKKDNGSYFLNYPNFEVLSAISRLFISNFVPSDSETSQGMMDLRQHLADGDVSKTVDNLRRMYACLSNYDRYSADKDLSESLKKEIRLKLADNFKTELRRMLSENFAPGFLSELGENVIELIPIDSDHNKHINNKIRENFMDLIRRKLSGSFKEDIGKKLGEMFEELFRRMFNGSLLDLIRLKLGENFYRSVLQAYLRGLEVMALPELESGLGRPDLVVKYKGRTYVFEIKTADNAAQAAQAAVIGMDQIRDRGYSEPYENPILVSLAVDKQRRNIGACIFEKDGEVSVIDIYK
jgi:hypothetical protein